MKKLATVAVAITMAGGLTACGSSSGSGSSDDSGDITIGSIHPTSGPLAGVGSLMDDGAKLAVDDINAAGGIEALDGRKLKLSSGDSQGKAEVGQSEAQRMIDDGAVALVGTYQSDVTQNVASVAERGRVPLVIDVAVDDNILEKGYKYSFRVQPNATSMGTSGAESLAAFGKQAGDPVTRVAYLHVEGSFGDSVFDAFKAKASEQGITDVKEITYPPTNFSDATTQVREAASYKPDVIVATGYFPDGVLIAKAVEELKPDIKGLYGIANGAFDDGSFPEAAGTAAAGVLGANYHYDAKSPKVQDIRKRFEKKYGKPMETASVLSYQAVEVIAAGLEDAKDADPEKLREAIAGVEIDEPLLAFDGPIAFDDKGQNENATVIVMQNLNKSIAQVYPEEFAEQKIQFPAATARRSRFTAGPGSFATATVVVLLAAVYLFGGKDTGLVTQAVVTGLLLGGVYALVSIGLTLIFGVLGIVNFAQGAMLTLAMYLVYVMSANAGIPVYAATLLAVPIMFALGMLIQQLLLTRLTISGSHEGPLLVTLGLSLLIGNVLLMIFGGRPKTVAGSVSGSVQVLGAVVSYSRLIAFVGAMVVALVITLVLSKTSLGLSIRAVAANSQGAQLVGVNINRIYALTFGIGSASVAVAGGLITPFTSLTPSVGEQFTILAFVIVVLGGLGSVVGATVGGLVVGLVQTVGGLYLPGTGSLILVFVVFVLVLFLRPEGLYGGRS